MTRLSRPKTLENLGVMARQALSSSSNTTSAGVLDRFPQLQIVSAENNIGWLPYYLQRMDRAFERQRISGGFINKLKPSEYFQRQMWATYIDDFVGVASRHFIGVDKLMWSSDYRTRPRPGRTRRRSWRATSRKPAPKIGSRSREPTQPSSTGSNSSLWRRLHSRRSARRRYRTVGEISPAPGRRRSHSRGRG